MNSVNSFFASVFPLPVDSGKNVVDYENICRLKNIVRGIRKKGKRTVQHGMLPEEPVLGRI
jgi:hypothetical protein